MSNETPNNRFLSVWAGWGQEKKGGQAPEIILKRKKENK